MADTRVPKPRPRSRIPRHKPNVHYIHALDLKIYRHKPVRREGGREGGRERGREGESVRVVVYEEI